ncbi:hypothetical protein [Actinoplanes sp. G11-F43]|uniref:hypothetical protein n=1 Tax=Actinoplanes sp. G11-F43 TaxID=3424130 RepID=UPI003D3362BE
MRELDFDGLRSGVGDAVRQPDFGTVRQRAGRVRRRRVVSSAAAFLVTVLTATGIGYAVQGAPHDRGLPGTLPAASQEPPAWPRTIAVTGTGTEMYGVLQPCRDCGTELHVSSDGGRSWQRRATPPAEAGAGIPRTAIVVALAPGLVAWRELRTVTIAEAEAGAPGDPPWITRDGGRTWSRPVIDTRPADRIPDGGRPVDCAMMRLLTCTVGAIDPVTGRFEPLAAQPTGITAGAWWSHGVNAPPGGHLWVPGLDPGTGMPAVAASTDAGRTWRTTVFTAAPQSTPWVAAGPGGTAYALIAGADDRVEAHHTADGGRTWRAGDTLTGAPGLPGFVTADGAHVTGLLAARGTGRYAPVRLPGLPGDPAPVQAGDPYLMNAATGPYLSGDGRTWHPVHLR